MIRRRLVALAIAGLVLNVAACSSGSDDSNGDAADTTLGAVTTTASNAPRTEGCGWQHGIH